MKVLHLFHYCRGGIVTVVLTQVERASASGIEYHIAVIEPCPELERYAQERGLHVHVLGGLGLYLPWRWWKLVRRLQVDVIHVHSYIPRVMTALLVIFGQPRLRLISTIHNDYPYFYTDGLKDRFKRFTEAWLLRRLYDRVICVSEKIRRLMQQRYRISPTKLKCVHNGIDVADADSHANAQTRDRAGDTHAVVVTVGRLSVQKNYAMLLRCWQQLQQQQPRAELWLVGDGELRASLEQQALSLGITSTTRFLGWRPKDEVHAILRSADVFVLSSLHEGLPTSILEAFVAGLPVVTTRVSGVEEMIDVGVSGYVADSPQEMTTALSALLSMTPQDRRAMGEQGRRRVLASFTAERYVQEVEQTYVEQCA